MYQDILSNPGYECQNCGKIGTVLDNGLCSECHYVIAHHMWASRQTDVIDTGKIDIEQK